jgi:hypothetical protein
MANINTKTRQGEMYSEDRSEMTPARRKMIQDHRKQADLYGPELPFQFGIFKPKLGIRRREVAVECDCGNIMYVTKITCMVVCPKCNSLCSSE